MSPAPTSLTEVVRTHLELSTRAALSPARRPESTVQLDREPGITSADYLRVYTEVGGQFHWTDRLRWSASELDAYLGSPWVQVWVLRAGGETAGFFELHQHGEGHVEIMYFGLVPAFVGRGLGGWLLTRAVEESFALGAARVILNTCTLDAPQALPNYIARGFRIVREERYTVELPAAQD